MFVRTHSSRPGGWCFYNLRGLDFQSFVENSYQHMKRTVLFVLSSQWEGLPTVLVEAMACGCPVVATDCPSGPREILAGGEYGILVPPKDPEKLAQGILQVLENRDLQRELSERGKQRALDFTVEKAVEEYVRLIERCCRSGDSLG